MIIVFFCLEEQGGGGEGLCVPGNKNRNRVLLQYSQDVFLNIDAGTEGESLNPD